MTEPTLQQRISVGQDAQRVLESEPFRNACLRAEERIIDDWKRGVSVADREIAHAKLSGLTAIVLQLRAEMDDGHMAASLLDKAARQAASP